MEMDHQKVGLRRDLPQQDSDSLEVLREVGYSQEEVQSPRRYLERQGLLECDNGNSYLTAQALDAPDDDPSHQLLGHSIETCRLPP